MMLYNLTRSIYKTFISHAGILWMTYGETENINYFIGSQIYT